MKNVTYIIAVSLDGSRKKIVCQWKRFLYSAFDLVKTMYDLVHNIFDRENK